MQFARQGQDVTDMDLVERAVLVVCAMFHLQVSDALALKAGREPGAGLGLARAENGRARCHQYIYIYLSLLMAECCVVNVGEVDHKKSNVCPKRLGFFQMKVQYVVSAFCSGMFRRQCVTLGPLHSEVQECREWRGSSGNKGCRRCVGLIH